MAKLFIFMPLDEENRSRFNSNRQKMQMPSFRHTKIVIAMDAFFLDWLQQNIFRYKIS